MYVFNDIHRVGRYTRLSKHDANGLPNKLRKIVETAQYEIKINGKKYIIFCTLYNYPQSEPEIKYNFEIYYTDILEIEKDRSGMRCKRSSMIKICGLKYCLDNIESISIIFLENLINKVTEMDTIIKKHELKIQNKTNDINKLIEKITPGRNNQGREKQIRVLKVSLIKDREDNVRNFRTKKITNKLINIYKRILN